MPLVASNVCCSSVPVYESHAPRRSPSSVTHFVGSARRRWKQRIARVYSYNAASDNCMLSSDGPQYGGCGNGLSRGMSAGSSACSTIVLHDLRGSNGMSSMHRSNVGSVHQTRFSSGIILDWKDGIVGTGTNSSNLGRTMGNGRFHLAAACLLRGRSPCLLSDSSKGWAIRCSITVPVPNEHSNVDNATKTEGGEISKDSSAANETKNTGREPVKAAFFDVDGTITRTNVVMAYFSVRMVELSFIEKLLWLPWFALSCILYLLVDYIHRPTFNRIFYSSYKGRATEGKTAMANLVFEQYYKPRIMAGAVEQIHELKQLGYHIVFVTGALDFQIAPLAHELGADYVFAAKLVEDNGRFTGELIGMGTSNSEKAERVWDYAKRFRVSLRDSLAFGDSVADIAMLEVVGRPYAVNPDARLQAIALKRGWAILDWWANKQKTAAKVPV